MLAMLERSSKFSAIYFMHQDKIRKFPVQSSDFLIFVMFLKNSWINL